jgi:hypothetical protein
VPAGALNGRRWREQESVPFAPVRETGLISTPQWDSDALKSASLPGPWTCVDVYVNPQNSESAENALVRVYGHVNTVRGEVGRGRITLAKGKQLVCRVRGEGADWYEVTIQSANRATASYNDGTKLPQITVALSAYGFEPLNRQAPFIKYTPRGVVSTGELVASGGQKVPTYLYEIAGVNPTADDQWIFVTDVDGNNLCPPVKVPKSGGQGSLSFGPDRGLLSPSGLVLHPSITSDVITDPGEVGGIFMQAGYV